MAAPQSSATLPRPDTDMSRARLLVTPPSQISHDTPGEDNLIPLSPQWLLPKTSDNKAGITPTEKYQTPIVAHGDRSDLMNSTENGDEMQENQKKTDVFRPTFLDYESERRDRWRDEERDTNLSVRKDRWREGDKEFVGNRKTDRWVDNSPARHVGEARWTPADKRADPSRENDHDQRHDSKWSNRWGPGNKQMDKKTDVGKYNDMPFDKGLSHSSNPGKDEKEGDRYRPWRPSSLQGRGRADPPHYHTQRIKKEVPTSNHERGHENNTPSTFSAGRGRVNYGGGSINTNQSLFQSPGFVPEKVDSGEEPSPLRYSRTKLLEIFRQIDIRSSNALEGLVHVSSLTQEESVEPLALCVPGPEESAILKAIDKGDIVSSGAPQISKDASSGRSTMDNHHRPTEHKYNVEGMREDSTTIKSEDEVFNNRDTTSKERASTQSSTPWRPSFLADPSRTLSGDGFDVPNDMHSRSSAMSWSEAQKERQDGRVADSSYSRNEVKWQGGKDSTDWKHSSVVVDRDVESRNLPQPSPEDLLLHYKDPQGLVQGPFSGTDIIGWFEAGYFGIDLQVRLASAPNNAPFSLLGDVMPHLRGKARAPPGFKTAKQTDVIDVPNQFSLSGLRNAIPGGVDLIGNECRPVQGSSRDAAPVVSNPSVNRESNIPQANPLSSINDIPQQYHPQKVSALQGFPDGSSSGINGLGGWLNLYGGSESFKGKIGMPHEQNFHQPVYNLQQHNPQSQIQASVTNLPGLPLDSQGVLTENLKSGLVQDPQLLNLLQQQYLLQLQSQQSMPGAQLSLQDTFLLLQQHQKQEEQQKLWQQQQLLLQQQQQLLSNAFLEQQLVQRFSDPLLRQLQVSAPAIDNSVPQLLSQMFQVNSQVPLSNMLVDRNVNAEISAAELSASSSMGLAPKSNLDIVDSALRAEYVGSADCKLQSSKGGANDILLPEVTNGAEACTGVIEETPGKESNEEVSEVKEPKTIESQEVKKTSEKKSRKQKSSKALPSTVQVKATKETSPQYSTQSAAGKVSPAGQSEVAVNVAGTLVGALESQADERELSASANLPGDVPESDVKTYQSATGNSPHRGWKPAASMKPKSLLEIQQEEQQRAQMEALVPAVSPSDAPMSSSTPWAGVSAYTESKVTRDNHPGRSDTDHGMELTDSSKNKKSELHDLLAAEVLTKSGVRNVEVPDKAFNLPPLPTLSKQLDSADDANFIEAKYTKKGRKKAAKANGAKPTASVTADLTVVSSPVEKAKSSKPVQVEKEVLPAPSSGLSLCDYVSWPEESTSPSAPVAWLSEPAKFPKPTSLRDILREQDKKATPVHSQTLAAQKPQSTKKSGGSRLVLASLPSKEAKPLVNSSESSSQSKFEDDDFFWGPPEHSKQETKPNDYHQLGNHGGRTARSTPVKGTPETSLSRKKSVGGKASQQYASSATVSAQIPAKGNRAGNSKHSEARDFRDWCESESVRLTGSKDTSVLEFCLKQTKTEAVTLLKENLGSFDPNHEFIEKFVNYMEVLPADVIEIAFPSRNDLRAYNYGAKDVTSDYGSVEVNDRDIKVVADGSVKGSKKKGKKGKKVSSSLLGFNVVSNRIMMGEIQTLED